MVKRPLLYCLHVLAVAPDCWKDCYSFPSSLKINYTRFWPWISLNLFHPKRKCFQLFLFAVSTLHSIFIKMQRRFAYIFCDYLPTNLYCSQYWHDRLNKFFCKASYKWIDFANKHCCTKPDTEPYSRNKDFLGHTSKRAPILFYVSSERTHYVRASLFCNKESVSCLPADLLLTF